MLLPQEYIRTCESLLPKASASRRNSVKVFKHSPGPRTDHTRYERTLALYEEVFGVAPNPNLWPDEAPERRTPPARPQSAVSSSGPERSPTGWFKIHVKTFAGEELSLNVRAGMSVDGVKQQIQDRAGIPPDQQCLIFAGRQVEDGRTLGFYNVSEGTMLHLVERLRGC
ncbi:hypothetical protein PybrP1_011929 [[Pythium] brassicae (nom. inval.)]|nr:hypothetical protein PybrP1_011929 [[Pythium] brassicae (nom. inval.)]